MDALGGYRQAYADRTITYERYQREFMLLRAGEGDQAYLAFMRECLDGHACLRQAQIDCLPPFTFEVNDRRPHALRDATALIEACDGLLRHHLHAAADPLPQLRDACPEPPTDTLESWFRLGLSALFLETMFEYAGAKHLGDGLLAGMFEWMSDVFGDERSFAFSEAERLGHGGPDAGRRFQAALSAFRFPTEADDLAAFLARARRALSGRLDMGVLECLAPLRVLPGLRKLRSPLGPQIDRALESLKTPGWKRAVVKATVWAKL